MLTTHQIEKLAMALQQVKTASERGRRAVRSGAMGAIGGLVAPHVAEAITSPKAFRAGLKSGSALLRKSGKGALGSGLVAAGLGALTHKQKTSGAVPFGLGFSMTYRADKNIKKGKQSKETKNNMRQLYGRT